MVEIPFPQRRIRDPHNYCGTVVKAVIDGLVMGGAWPDDTPEYVGHLEPSLYVTPRVSSMVGADVWVHIFDAMTYVLSPDGWAVAE